MNSCMMQHATQEEQDRAREEWFATRDLRKKERAEEQEKLKEKKKFHREWWGLDEHGRRIPGKGPEPDSGGATKSG
jgi:COX assembly mitochondrial protein 1